MFYFVAVPLTEDNSARREAQIILPLIDDKTCVVSHGGKYSTSLVFYSGAKIYRLETQDNYEKIRPKDMTWTSKNVMPFMTFDELPTDKKIIAIVSAHFEKSFVSNAAIKARTWELVGEVQKGATKSKIYRRNPDGDNR